MIIYTVDELTNYIKNLLEDDELLMNISIKGEISNLRKVDGNIYFTLKDKNSVIECTMFFRAASFLEFSPEDGMNVIIMGAIEVYRRKGIYQVIVEEIKKEGLGDLYIKFLKLKEKLEKEGLFNKDLKKKLPLYPKKIGLISSLEGAALRDIIKVFRRKYSIELIIYSSLVQGEKAQFSIINGIEYFNNSDVDLIIIARGGGSFEDLQPFNEENLAYAIFLSKIPIITGIGHEIDNTIADFVADYSSSTPTSAADIVVPDKDELLNRLNYYTRFLTKIISEKLTVYKKDLSQLTEKALYKKPFNKIREFQQLLDEYYLKLKSLLINKIILLKKDITSQEIILNNLSFESTLKRGFTLTMKNEEIITSINNLKNDELITTIYKDGETNSIIKKIKFN